LVEVETDSVYLFVIFHSTNPVTRAFGDVQHKDIGDGKHNIIDPIPDISSYDIQNALDEFLVLASDGLWDIMLPQQVVNFVRKSLSVKKQHNNIDLITKNVVNEALRLGSVDNVSVVIIIFNNKK